MASVWPVANWVDGDLCDAGTVLRREAALLAAALPAPHGAPGVVETDAETDADSRRPIRGAARCRSRESRRGAAPQAVSKDSPSESIRTGQQTGQGWIDQGTLAGKAVTADAVCEMHRRFGEPLPPELLQVENPDTGELLDVVPGELRHRDVRVGAHVPVSPGAVPRFLSRFAEVYGQLGRAETILAAAAAHHRLLWIHPFLDGNGRVARLMSHAILLDALDTGGVWSVARGLARAQATYEGHLVRCDGPRRNDLDGRGSLSEEALAEFTRFFLETPRAHQGYRVEMDTRAGPG